MKMKEKIRKVKKIQEEVEATDTCLMVPIHAHDSSTMPLLLKVDGKIRTLDVSKEHEPDQETIDILVKIGCPSWKEFRKRILFMTRCTQDTNKAPLFPKQNSTTMPPREASHSPQETG
jgi:hypothetical protein